jgi:hypothetical protein
MRVSLIPDPELVLTVLTVTAGQLTVSGRSGKFRTPSFISVQVLPVESSKTGVYLATQLKKK